MDNKFYIKAKGRFIMKILSKAVFLMGVASAFADTNVVVNQVGDFTKEPQNDSAQSESSKENSLVVNAVQIGDEKMSPDEAVSVLSKANLLTGVNVGSNDTISENSFAMASIVYELPRDEALKNFKRLFEDGTSLESKIYALMGFKLLKDNYQYKTLGITLDSSAVVSSYVNGKIYKISLSKFLSTFDRKPTMFVPSKFPNLEVENSPFDETQTTQNTQTVVSNTTTIYTDFGTVLYPVVRPVIIVTRPCRRPIVIHRPPRPIIAPRPVITPPHRPSGKPVITPPPAPNLKPNRPQPRPQPRPVNVFNTNNRSISTMRAQPVFPNQPVRPTQKR